VHGFGAVTTTTQGGTSAPLTLNEMQTATDCCARSRSRDEPDANLGGGQQQPGAAASDQYDTGADIRDINVSVVSHVTNDSGATSFFGGLQVVPSAFKLLGANIPAGDLLAFYGTPNPDYAVAINPTGTARRWAACR